MAEEMQTCAALRVGPKRIIISVVAAAAISALLLYAGGQQSGSAPGILKKDDPITPKVYGTEHRPVMRRETPVEKPMEEPIERPSQWGHLMRKEAKEVVAVPTGRGPTMCAACIFSVLAIYSFGQQLRSAFQLLRQGFSQNDIKSK
ncbi:Uncharacterized protein SCF082_LOCUS18453 [Durusdinium trenchii]|uniref:Transmembrane protein n=1 Tax=Durusdinium trenchii TaxID=1381693 RepID=A0ABP0KRP7_9DINO